MAIASESRTSRIAMLNTDTPVPNVFAKMGSYGAIFHSLLAAAASRVAPHLTIESEDFNVVLGEYPQDISQFDVILVTGSAASAYDDADWIHRLSTYLQNMYRQLPEIKMFGSCFGHQIICQALLEAQGVYVEKNPAGWEIGVQDMHLTHEFVEALGPGRDRPRMSLPHSGGAVSPAVAPRIMRQQFVHADHVNIPPQSTIPEDWIIVGTTQKCAVQGMYQAGRVLTYQGHFEFDRFVNSETLKVFGAMWEPELLQAGLDQIDLDDDADWAAEVVVQFILERKISEDRP
ncbi:class I glutamine amidotransferase-like protein [Xylariaceae sp. FL1272]|nr:class I glutamine amidotransferase-like protein [Xylariaceae sp. FL1272]